MTAKHQIKYFKPYVFFGLALSHLFGVGPLYLRLQAARSWVVSLSIWASLRFLFTTDSHVIWGLPRPRGLILMSSTFLVMWSQFLLLTINLQIHKSLKSVICNKHILTITKKILDVRNTRVCSIFELFNLCIFTYYY